jgi:DNA helicase-2/ATP-dependent DNA helicase PcrA
MAERAFSIEDLWKAVRFEPNRAQERAIRHAEGPLYLTAGPGSGKTRVLLWRTLNLIVFHQVDPREIFLSTFTEKAALQLREGLQALLGMVTNRTGTPYDLTQMYVGTVHSLCQRMITDRRFSTERQRVRAPRLLDELGQYFHLYRSRNWKALTSGAGMRTGANSQINQVFHGNGSQSRHYAVRNCMRFFNRLSEECVDPEVALQRLCDDEEVREYLAGQGTDCKGLELLLRLYGEYRRSLGAPGGPELTDFSLVQQAAYEALKRFEDSDEVFRHVIVDEYQDTNTIQERLFFKLANGHRNICVVGDDDQALYRFRGATVENFVDFPERCKEYLGVRPKRITLSVNYRSRKRIVEFCKEFLTHCDWGRDDGSGGSYRVADKKLHAHRVDEGPAVVASNPGKPEEVFEEIAGLVRWLVDEGKVENENQVAFLFPSVKYRGEMTTQVRRMKEALEEEGFRVYAPRAGRFLEVDEAVDTVGLLAQVFGTPASSGHWGGQYQSYQDWLKAAEKRGEELLQANEQLARYVADARAEMQTAVADYEALMGVVERKGWDLKRPYLDHRMKQPLYEAPGLSERAHKALSSTYLERIARLREQQGTPFALGYVVNRATSVDWNVLDVFYRLCGFDHFRRMFDLAERGEDEGPICNLALMSEYLSRFVDEYVNVITARLLADGMFQRLLFGSFLYALYRLGESEYEDAEDPFPKGRIPFLTIHQSKGLEFPVVVLASPRKDNRGPQKVETLARPFLERKGGEPLDRTAEFDIMRMFYVALSRAKNLLIIGHLKGRGQRINKPFQEMLDDGLPRIPELDLDTVPAATLKDERLPRSYSYTGDYLRYKECPRQYMIFEKYGFVSSRLRTMFFGSLVHQTLDDLHNHLITLRENSHG